MKKLAGVWIDYKKAVVVKLESGKEVREEIESAIEHHPRIDGEGKNFTRMGDQYFSAEKNMEEKMRHQKKQYLSEVINHFKDYDELYICGPAMARKDLAKEIKAIRLNMPAITGSDSCDHITQNQVAERVRKHFEWQ